ncbi:MAG: sugar kinase, partial [Candidatus Puniceispirillum sp.]
EAVVDFPNIVIGGAVPPAVLDQIVSQTEKAFGDLNKQGITRPEFSAGSAGPNARAIGASLLPISKRFLLETTEFNV